MYNRRGLVWPLVTLNKQNKQKLKHYCSEARVVPTGDVIKTVRDRFKVRRSSVSLKSKDDVITTTRPRTDVGVTIKSQKIKHTHDVVIRNKSPTVKAPEVNFEGWNKRSSEEYHKKKGLIRSRLPVLPPAKGTDEGFNIVEVVKKAENTDDVIKMRMPTVKGQEVLTKNTDDVIKARSPMPKGYDSAENSDDVIRMRAPIVRVQEVIENADDISRYQLCSLFMMPH